MQLPSPYVLRRIVLVGGPLVSLAVSMMLVRAGLPTPAVWCGGVTTLCALWWVLEPIPIPATSLIPLAVFPAVGVLSASEVGSAYGHKMILLLMGGFILSTAMERSGTHRRLALQLVRLVGGDSSRRLIFGFMLAAASLSMWISNAATTLMLLPIAMATVEKLPDKRVASALLIGLAYAASIGGVGTPVGTPPNLIFMNAYQEATGREVSFLTWMMWAMPVVVIMVPVAAWLVSRGLPKKLDLDLPEPGKWRAEEVRTLAVFAVTAMLWVTRGEPLGGWSGLLGIPGANDATVALLAVVAMFVIPNGRGGPLLDWETAVAIPWGVLLLFSSGMVIGDGFAASGLSDAVGAALGAWGDLPLPLLMGLICLAVTFLTEVSTNTAMANLLMPILAALAQQAKLEPRQLMAPAAISASFAFMLPVATAPNAIVFGSNRIALVDMARKGFALNLIGVGVVTLVFYLLG
ncbi:MAG: SLC13/DASS family transporter [Planctomycetales bacterium]|nr:SLC13/DASS family transporter [Planctomycetales bacterium]